jgi:nucleoside-diphosphate-sugar epimerase
MSQPKTIFMTGASGYIGSVITEFAIPQGYKVRGLSRNETNDAKLRSLGAEPVRGDIQSLDVLREEARAADAVIHLVDVWLAHMNEPYEVVIDIDNKAVGAMCDGLAGSNKPFVLASGSAIVENAPEGKDTDETAPYSLDGINKRYKCEEYALGQAKRGIRVVSIRLALYVYGRGGSGVKRFMGMGLRAGSLFYVGDGARPTSSVHVDDAARLFLLAVEKGRAGEAYNCVNSTGASTSSKSNAKGEDEDEDEDGKTVTLKQLNEAMSKVLDIPVASKTFDEAVQIVGPIFAKFLSRGDSAVNAKAVGELGWETREAGAVREILEGSYVDVARRLKEGEGK